mmetsp:Transcript_51379/g.111693  ORF Transcript_51379/g.111693 Transcript_51379/m.111693 type:complete len:241 (-) Transcript_51379:89-811(-)
MLGQDTTSLISHATVSCRIVSNSVPVTMSGRSCVSCSFSSSFSFSLCSSFSLTRSSSCSCCCSPSMSCISLTSTPLLSIPPSCSKSAKSCSVSSERCFSTISLKRGMSSVGGSTSTVKSTRSRNTPRTSPLSPAGPCAGARSFSTARCRTTPRTFCSANATLCAVSALTPLATVHATTPARADVGRSWPLDALTRDSTSGVRTRWSLCPLPMPRILHAPCARSRNTTSLPSVTTATASTR